MLTGKTRHRIGLRGRLVLQVEYWGDGGYDAKDGAQTQLAREIVGTYKGLN